MSLPPWIDELKARYLNDEASVFVLHGPGLRDVWRLDDAPMAAEAALITFLQRSREIVGRWSFKEGLKFNNPSDHSLFTRAVEARQALDGATRRLNPRESLDALGLIWLAISTPGRRLGFVLSGVEGLLPENRKRIDPLPGNTPALADWPSNATLRSSDNVIVILMERLDRVRPELLQGCVIIEVPAAPKAAPPPPPAPPAPPDHAVAEAEVEALSAPPPPPPPPMAPAEAEVEAIVSQVSAPQVSAAPPPPPIATSTLAERLDAALRAAILRHPQGGWVQNLPAREAIAEVLHAESPQLCGPLALHVVEDQVKAVGPGAEWFEGWFRADVAVDAAAGMLLGGLEVPQGGFTPENLPPLSGPALRALSRRVERALTQG
ncbi:MAG: hypothetical protein RIT28_3552 [Pseudomonadota bacterium]